MKILLVHTHYQVHGGEDVVFEQERQLLERAGHQVRTYCRSNFEGDAYIGLRRIALAKNTVWSTDTQKQLARVLSEEKPDVMHVHNTFLMMSPSIFATCREMGVPVVQSLHNYRLFCANSLFLREGKICEECTEHSVLRAVRYGCFRESRSGSGAVALMLTLQRRRQAYPDLFVALSEFSRRKFVANGIPAEKVCVKPNFVFPDPGEREHADGTYAVYVGRLSQEKGAATLLEAWRLLPRSIPLSMVGDGPLQEELQKKAADLGLNNITFHGRLSREKTLETIKSARLLVLPGESYEHFPMGIVEAFACGVPVICSRLGGMQELVDDARTGLHFTVGDPADLASKVRKLWDDHEGLQATGKAARREYEDKYTAERNYPQLMAIYQRVIALNNRAAGSSSTRRDRHKH